MGKTIAQNRRARFDYFIEENLEAGLVLFGSEIKSIRQGKVTINEAYAGERDGAIYLLNSHISEYTGANRFNHEPTRPRKLLLHKRQQNKLLGAIKRKGITLVPLSLYFNAKGLVKLDLGIAKGKKQHDKRATEKERDWSREKAKIMKDG
ncbi:MAG: SsrA-binding protein SmpB [Alphaproteobacteria bacterium]